MMGPMLRPEQNGEKIIRHRTPDDVLKRDGRRMMVRPVEGEEHLQFLKWKLEEEAAEVASATGETVAEEIADVRQALIDFCAVAGIKPALVRVADIDGVPTAQADRIAFFRGLIERLGALAASVPDDDMDRVAHVGEMLGVIGTMTDMAGIREAVRTELAKKFEAKGGFIPGLVWKVPEEAMKKEAEAS